MMKHLQRILGLAFILFTTYACSMNNLPRNMSLKAFDPHRKDFVCKYEADAVPPIDAQAEAWLQEGLRVTSRDLWPKERDYAKAAQLWQQAADRKHWKAMLNLASAYAYGEGVPRDTERAVQIVEEAMKLGIPAAFDLMGTYHMEGRGVKQDASRAYAFWELAADMGSPSAMAYLGRKLRGTYDNPPSVWSNRKVAFKMLECGVAQGNGRAAFELGLVLDGADKSLGDDYARALKVLHEGVKFGSMESARHLFGAFDDGDPLVNNSKDPGRAGRYRLLTDALEHNPDLRFPNLDKILPLPPAPLPKWDGDEDTLIDAAKQVMPAPAVQPTPGSQHTGRAHIPQGYALPQTPLIPAAEWHGKFDRRQAQMTPLLNGQTALYSGYWLAQLTQSVREFQREWNSRQVPLRYAQGEAFDTPDRRSLGEYAKVLGVQWHYMGELVKLADPAPPIEVARGIARMSRIPTPLVICRGGRPCPRTGIWEPKIEGDHLLATVFHDVNRQAYVEKGQPFPDPRDAHLDIDANQVQWLWADNANQPAPVGKQITLTDLHDEQGKPLA
ncbi:tetratricopeptide repeat protein [Variovorax humicola]|uniref:Tetratricopeptide repeat protein n=1 Tax=Variovorax humicola TaxID=1769758 RepID=A0ABU8WBN1_9BURK